MKNIYTLFKPKNLADIRIMFVELMCTIVNVKFFFIPTKTISINIKPLSYMLYTELIYDYANGTTKKATWEANL